MSLLVDIARRTFLVGSLSVAGGVVFGIYKYKEPHKNPLKDGLGGEAAAITPYVKIDKDGITLITPHADLGQGVHSMMAALIAEELDLELDQFAVSHGVPSAAYYNTAIAAESAPSGDNSLQAQVMQSVMSAAFKFLGMQVTGGSTAAPDSFDKLRVAGAVARETLKKVAAQENGLRVAELRTEAGSVIFPDGQSIPYTELAVSAAKIKPVTDVTLREPEQWRLIGKEMKRLDIIPKSTGKQLYGIDLSLPDMVYAAAKMNPRQGGALNGYDASAAKTMRGVTNVLEIRNGVVVIADNTWRAQRAVEMVDCDWGAAPYPDEMEAHWQEIGNSFEEARLDNIWRNDGDVDAAMEGADTIEAEYRAPYVAHAPLEPLNALGLMTNERVDIWAGHQIPRIVEQKVAEITGHQVSQVHFHNQYSGGSFGHRLEFENILQIAEIIKQLPNTPVKLTFSREEDFLHDYPRQIAMSRPRGAVSDEGVLAYDLRVAAVSSSASQSARMGISVPGPDAQIAAGGSDLPFAIPNFKFSAYRVPELAPTSSWRSVGASSTGFFSAAFLDELIHAAGKDPLEELLRLCNNEVARSVLEAVGEMSNWGSALGLQSGRGLALVHSFGVPVAEIIEVTDTDKGIRVDKVFVAVDVGRVIDPINFENHVQGAVVWALGHAINSEITYSDGIAQQTNYHAHEGMRLYQCPEIYVRGLENSEQIRGIGEPPVPPAAPALANAIFAATGNRIREMPFNKHIRFV